MPQEPAAPKGIRAPRGTRVAVYSAVTVLVLLLALVARGFSRQVGDAHLAGRFSLLPLLGSRSADELALTWNGLTLHFARTMTPALVGFESSGAGTDIVFEGGARLRVSPGSDTGGSISLAPVGAAVGGSVVVPFSLQGVIEDPPPRGSALAWKKDGRTFLLSLPSGGSEDAEAQTLTMPLAGTAAAVLQVQGVLPAARSASAAAVPVPSAARLPRESDMPDGQKLQAALSSWRDAAWQGWSAARYSADGTWRMADGAKGFSEDIGVGLLSESVARGQWQKMFALWSDALATRPATGGSLAFTSAAYVGGVKDFAAALRQSAGARVTKAASALGQPDSSALQVPDLVPLLLDHGSPELVQKAAAYLAGRSPSGLDLASAVSLTADLLDCLALLRPDDSLRALLKQTVESRLLTSARRTDAGVFLDSGNGTCDVRGDILAGALLLKAGTVLGSTLAPAVGRGLIVSALSLADESGFLPATLSFSGARLSRKDGSLAPESVYALLPGAPFVPRETPLASQVGSGAWIWTSASIASVAGTSTGVTLVFSYPRGVPYNLVLQGLKPFALLKLHGIPWHSDPTYFKYSDGWSYDSGSQTLFMKITPRQDQEEVDITF